MTPEQGVGKCREGHLGSFGFPTRPDEPYPFCPQCGEGMVWRCPHCEAGLPADVDELRLAHFCPMCGEAYFDDVPTSSPQE